MDGIHVSCREGVSWAESAVLLNSQRGCRPHLPHSCLWCTCPTPAAVPPSKTASTASVLCCHALNQAAAPVSRCRVLSDYPPGRLFHCDPSTACRRCQPGKPRHSSKKRRGRSRCVSGMFPSTPGLSSSRSPTPALRSTSGPHCWTPLPAAAWEHLRWAQWQRWRVLLLPV